MYYLRDICGKQECNQKLIKAVESSTSNIPYYREGLMTIRQADELLKSETFESIAKKLSIKGTKWYIAADSKDVQYHSIAKHLSVVFNRVFYWGGLPLSAEILDVKEKKLGYDRRNTVKITSIAENAEGVLCYITAETEECDVPKKQSNSKGKGTMITDIKVSKPDTTLYDLFENYGICKDIVRSWLYAAARQQIERLLDEANPKRNDENENAALLMQYAAKYANEYAKELQKL